MCALRWCRPLLRVWNFACAPNLKHYSLSLEMRGDAYRWRCRHVCWKCLLMSMGMVWVTLSVYKRKQGVRTPICFGQINIQKPRNLKFTTTTPNQQIINHGHGTAPGYLLSKFIPSFITLNKPFHYFPTQLKFLPNLFSFCWGNHSYLINSGTFRFIGKMFWLNSQDFKTCQAQPKLWF